MEIKCISDGNPLPPLKHNRRKTSCTLQKPFMHIAKANCQPRKSHPSPKKSPPPRIDVHHHLRKERKRRKKAKNDILF